MSILSDLFSSSVGEVVKSVGEVADELFTSDEEKLYLKQKLKEIELNAKIQLKEIEIKEEQEKTKRWESDNVNGSWLSKNVRPVSLVYLMAIITAMAFSDGNIGQFKIDPAYVTLFQTLAVTAFSGYFVMRTFDKFNKERYNNNQNNSKE